MAELYAAPFEHIGSASGDDDGSAATAATDGVELELHDSAKPTLKSIGMATTKTEHHRNLMITSFA
ncbi:MAG: hypothetical protein KF894_21450 [Labilithrix sp.]|nr:hypothetical protein [Labilithrix sp.]